MLKTKLVRYLLMMRLYTNVETSYEMTKNIRQEIKAATFEFNDVPFTFDDIATYEEVISLSSRL